MIRISLDEAYVFDMLSIITIKLKYNKDNKQISDSMDRMMWEIGSQIGIQCFNAVVESKEFKSLIKANKEIFDRINAIKQRGEKLGDATFVDMRNYDRFLAKKALQKKFFPGKDFTEQKFGYDQK